VEDRHDAQFRAQAERVMSRARRKGSAAAWLIALLVAFAAVFAGLSAPATAHGKKQEQSQAQQMQQAAPGGAASGAAQPDGMMNGMAMDRSQMPFLERLVDWFGRLHPLVVHFPIAFFPAALFTAVVGRRRPAFAAPVQFLVVAGGIFAPIAAAAGWITGLSADPEPILAYHRWLGVVIGITGAGLGIWAWKRPWEDRGAGMIAALTVMTIAIAVQGFWGAALTHGMDHLMF
jgi:uncharacterized membrane protein